MDRADEFKGLYIRAKVILFEENLGLYYYTWEIKSGSESTEAKWTVKKRYSDFVALHKNLLLKYADLPELPKKTWFKMYEAKDLDQRKRELNDYLMALCKKEALTNDGDFHSSNLFFY